MKKFIIVGVATLAASSAVLAATPINSGVYLEGNMGYGKVRINSIMNSSDKALVKIKKDSGFAWNINGGYKINKNVGVEVGYTQYPKVKLQDRGTGATASDKNYAIDGAVKGILPMQNGFSAFAKVGAAYAGQKASGYKDHKIVPYGGIGVGYAVTPNLELTVQGAGHTKRGDVASRWTITGGATYII